MGGGIHGLGIAHDLVSRGVKDVWVFEQNTLGSGTSSWSTKLIHGGLRYLENISEWRLVRSSLAEREMLRMLVPDLVKPLPLLYPVRHGGNRKAYQIQIGLWMYDKLARHRGFPSHSSVDISELSQCLAGFRVEEISKCFQFWDAITDDLGLCLRVASSAHGLGANLCEGAKVESIESVGTGYRLALRFAQQAISVESSAVVLATGPWAHELLKKKELAVKIEAFNNKGVHLVLEDLGLSKGIFLETVDPHDGRIFFALPWHGHTLVGTTEKIYSQHPDDQRPEMAEIDYLIRNFAYYTSYSKEDIRGMIRYVYSGLRWLVKEDRSVISKTSREDAITVHSSGVAKLWTLYGGKLTGYRTLSKQVGDQVAAHLRHQGASKTHLSSYWVGADKAIKQAASLEDRFLPWCGKV